LASIIVAAFLINCYFVYLLIPSNI
jgi:hypothetical protein